MATYLLQRKGNGKKQTDSCFSGLNSSEYSTFKNSADSLDIQIGQLTNVTNRTDGYIEFVKFDEEAPKFIYVIGTHVNVSSYINN